jgi:hypothetical protein
VIGIYHQRAFLLNLPPEGQGQGKELNGSVFFCLHLKLPNYDSPIKKIHFSASFDHVTFDS